MPTTFAPDGPSDQELCALVRSGDRQALDALCRRHLPMVKELAGRTRVPDPGDRDDLVQEGLIGVCKAARCWRPERGVKFSSYAWVAAERAMWRWLRDRERKDRLREVAGDLDLMSGRVRGEPPTLPDLQRLSDPLMRRVLELRFGYDGRPLKPGEIGERLRLSVPEVQKITSWALQELRSLGQGPASSAAG